MPAAETPKRRWTFAETDDAQADALAASAGVSRAVARILLARGVEDPDAARRFLQPDIGRDWRAPSTIPGMDECADEVAAAIRDGLHIVVFGDFDADGVTAAALLTLGLRGLDADAAAIVPHRFNEGYGLTEASVERLLAMSPGLVVTVDCGISSCVEVDALVAAGVRVVVTDHHEPGGDVPRSVPLTDPMLPGAPFSGLSGAGVALKLLQAVCERRGRPDVWLEYTDLAAIGTIADVVPLIDENRALVAHGLARMRTDPRPGVAALSTVAGVDLSTISAEKVSFGLSPRINAAGRMADPAEALELLCADDPGRAEVLAKALDEYNRLRRTAESEMLQVARAQAERAFAPDDRALVLSGNDWHEGVKGIVAGRLAALYGVPVLIFALQDGVARGSGRSVADVDLHAAVSSCSAMLTRYGGHAAAVGVTLPEADLPAFAASLKAALDALPREAFVPRLALDAEVRLADMSSAMAAEFDTLEPFGHGNPRPMLASRGVFMNGRKRVGADASHLRFEAYDGLASHSAIAFRLNDIERTVGTASAVDLAYHLSVDEWRGRERLQLLVRDVSVHSAPADGPAGELIDELFADAGRILSRGDYEHIDEAEAFFTKLAGVTFEGRQEVVGRLRPGAPLRLERQPDNPHDASACALFDSLGDSVGFLNRRLAAVLAPAIDGGADYDVSVADVTGGQDGESLGVNVLVERRRTTGEESVAEDRAALRAELAALTPEDLDGALVRHLIGDRPLHDAQIRSLEHLAQGRSCLSVMATGRGKSLIFHLHAARIALAGGRASIFVYPLRALVADQSFHLADRFADIGLTATVITGESSPGSRDATFSALADGRADVLMTTPEFLERHADRFAAAGRVGFVVVDEAHHVGLARAGHRPAYARMGAALATLDSPTVLAVTATAGGDIAAVVRDTLGIDHTETDPHVRDNLRVADHRGASDKMTLLSVLAARGEKTIVYVNSREQSVGIAAKLREAAPGLLHRVAFYNGGMSKAARQAVATAFRDGDIDVVVATSAFGEGVNVPDVRNVVLFHLPFNRVEFNQMCGRGGRDGAPAWVHLLFGDKDARLNELILESSAPDLDDLRTLYLVLRERGASAEEGWIDVTNAELADSVKAKRSRARLSEKGVSAGIGVFREMGFVSGEGFGSYRRLRLEDVVGGKADLTTSVRYAEGLQEAEDFSEFRRWALGASPEELLAAFDRPILPST